MKKYKYIRCISDSGIITYINEQGVTSCDHEDYANGEKLKPIKVVTDWGNKSYVCPRCGRVMKRVTIPNF